MFLYLEFLYLQDWLRDEDPFPPTSYWNELIDPTPKKKLLQKTGSHSKGNKRDRHQTVEKLHFPP